MTANIFRRLRVVLLTLAALTALAAGPATAQRERILAFDSDVTVRPDGVLRVVETIEVEAAGAEIRRGIFRDFPTRNLTADGVNRRVGFEIVRIERDGMPEPYFTEKLNAGLRIYIGRRDVLLSPGKHRYTVTYDTSRQLLHRPGEDELYWNVTGDAWAFPIDRATVTVRLPEGGTVDRVIAFTGPRGARGDHFRVTERAGGTLRLSTTRSLAPGEGLTIAVVWPEGAVARPTSAERLTRLALDNAGLSLGAILLVVLLVYFGVVWHRVGRDPAKGVVFPRFEAPDGLSPVAVGYIWNGGFGGEFGIGRALTVAITSLATRRRLVIDDDGLGSYTLSTRPGPDPWARLPKGEKAVHRALFDDDAATISFGNTYSPTMRRASDKLQDAFGWEYGLAYFRNNSRRWLIGAAIAAAAVLASLAIDADGEDGWLVVSVMAVFASALQVIATVMVVQVAARCRAAATIGAAWRPLLSLGQLAGAAIVLPPATLLGWLMTDMVAPAAIPVAALPVPVAVLYWYLMKAPTRLGRRTLDAIEGYRLYLSVAEADRLNRTGREPEVTEALFETHLPYAMALGVEVEWTGKVMTRLEPATDAPNDGPRYQPDWYRGPVARSVGRMSLAGALSEGLGGAAASAMTRPSSSGSSSGGFSGGGSSGGGGGGGGGGGW